MTYTRTARLDTRGQASAAAITAFLQSRAPVGLAWVRANEGPRIRQYLHIEPVELELMTVPDDAGDIIVAACARWAHLAVDGRQVIVNHDIVTGGIGHESAWLQSVIYRLKRNPAGYGAENANPVGLAHTFTSLAEAIDMYVRHLCGYLFGDGPWRSTRFHLLGSNAGTVREAWQLEQKYAWSDPDTYAATPLEDRYGANITANAAALVDFANNGSWGEDKPMQPQPIIALAAGHHNTDKGGAVGEYQRVGPLTRELARQLRAHGGFDVRVITPDDGMGDYAGGLQDVAREAVRLTADMFLEVHFEGVGNSAVRGCFAIYPDWPPDTDNDVRDIFGPDVAQRIKAATNIPLRGNGTMSEKSTGVGGQGFRLGAFSASASARATMTRTIIEYGTLTNMTDRAIIDGGGFNERAATATVSALAAFYGVAAEQPGGGGGSTPPPDDRILVAGNPFGPYGYALGFKGRALEVGAALIPADPTAGALAWLGWPVGDEYLATDGCVYQETEFGWLRWTPNTPRPWDIRFIGNRDIEIPAAA